MIGFIVSGHGRFATGITEGLQLIMGKQEKYIAVDFPEGDTKTEIENNLRKAIAQLDDCEHIIIFCDLLSGTPFNTAIMEAMNSDKLDVIYGTNLGMIVESIFKRSMNESVQDILDGAVEAGKEGIGYFVNSNDEDDDF